MRNIFAMLPVWGLLMAMSAPSVRADDIVSVTASNLTFLGNDVCGPTGTAQCIETFNGSFLWDNTTAAAVAGSELNTVSGPLGPFSTLNAAAIVPGVEVAVSWIDSQVDEITLVLYIAGNVLPPGAYPLQPPPPVVGNAAAALATIGNFFLINDFPGSVFPSSGTVNVSAVPEPSSLLLLCSGLLGLGLLVWRRSRPGVTANFG